MIKIITLNGYELLLSSYKVAILLEEIWVGKNTFDCNGGIKNFSMLSYLLWAPIRKIKGRTGKIFEIITFNYNLNIDQNFWF